MWFKILAGVSVGGAIIAWLTLSMYQENSVKQDVARTELKKESLKFDQEMNMFNANMFNVVDNNKTGNFYLKQAEQAKKELADIKKKEEEEKRKLALAKKRLDKQLETMDKETSVNWESRKMDKDITKEFSLDDI